MKKNMQSHIKTGFFAILCCTALLFTFQLRGQNLSSEVLYANGYKNYTDYNWVYASVYLFAYIQRNPAEFSDPAYKKEVIAAYDFSVKQLNEQKKSYDVLVAKEKKQSGDGSIASTSSGLSLSPPALRKNPPTAMIKH
ncbi:MAG: hypothetical protein QM726_15075 [Chitinophagaceae bacterium]